MYYASQLIVLLIGCAAGFLLLLTVQPTAPEDSAPRSPTSSRTLLSLIIFGCLMVLLLNFFEHMRIESEVAQQSQAQTEALAKLQNQVNALDLAVGDAGAHLRISQEVLKDQELIWRTSLGQLSSAITKIRSGGTGPVVPVPTPIAPPPPVSTPPPSPTPAASPPAPASSAANIVLPPNPSLDEKRLYTEIKSLERERDQLVSQREAYRRQYEANRVNERDGERALQLAQAFRDYTAFMDQRIATQNGRIQRRVTEFRALRGN